MVEPTNPLSAAGDVLRVSDVVNEFGTLTSSMECEGFVDSLVMMQDEFGWTETGAKESLTPGSLVRVEGLYMDGMGRLRVRATLFPSHDHGVNCMIGLSMGDVLDMFPCADADLREQVSSALPPDYERFEDFARDLELAVGNRKPVVRKFNQIIAENGTGEQERRLAEEIERNMFYDEHDERGLF